MVSLNLYKPWGESRTDAGTTLTDYGFTGQRSMEGSIGLDYYNARWYDSSLGRFTQADTIIPQPLDPLSWDRYSYVSNNPVRYTDPTGHCELVCIIVVIVGAVIMFSQIPSDQYQPDPKNQGNGYVFVFGLTLMISPAIYMSYCTSNPDACQKEIHAASETGKAVGENTDPGDVGAVASDVVSSAASLTEEQVNTLLKAGVQNPDSNQVVIGKFNNYLKIAKNIPGASYLDVPEELYNKLITTVDQWKQVQNAFLNDAIAKGKTFILSDPIADATGLFKYEIDFLLQAGYQPITENGVTELIPPTP